MTISMIETVEDDIKTALNAESSFIQPNFTIFSAENDEDEDADFEYDVPNIIYGNESTPVDYFMDGTRMFSSDFVFQVNVNEFNSITVGGTALTRKRLVNYALDKLQKTLNDMTFSNVDVMEFNTTVGETAAQVPIGEDEFLYRGALGMSVTYIDATG
tara:strand:+ start:2998 stop:3471 length:474 start_codon:yes stop_codon:yes gene_type:complete